MPSGKRARQQRQAAVPRPPAGGAGGLGARQASPRTLAIAGGVIVLVIVGVVLAIVLSNKSGSGGSNNASYDGPTVGVVVGNGIPAIGKSSTSKELAATDVASLLAGIPQKGLVLGQSNAPVTLTEFIDLQCPDCQQFELTEFPDLVTKYVKTGKLKIVMKPWEILDRAGTGVDDSHRGQKATIAASFQNKAFNFAAVLYNNQGPEDSGWMNDGAISNIAAAVDGLDLQKLATDANSSQTATLVHQVDTLATQLAAKFPPTQTSGFGGTPGIFLSKGLGPLVLFNDASGVPQLSALEAEITRLAK